MLSISFSTSRASPTDVMPVTIMKRWPLAFLEIAATGVRRYIVEGASESLTLVVGRLWIAHELHLHATLLEDDLLATELLAYSS